MEPDELADGGFDVIVVGGGQSGLATAFGLQGDAAIPFLESVGAIEARRRREVRDTLLQLLTQP